MIVEILLFFVVALALVMLPLIVLATAVRTRWWMAVPVVAAILAIAAAVDASVTGDQLGAECIGLAALALVLLCRVWQPRWSWLACLLFVTVVWSSLAYLGYAGLQTYATGLPWWVVVPSTVLLLLEILALGLSASFTFEICDVLGCSDPPLPDPNPADRPLVCIQVPTYNEPVEVVQPTLESLSRLDYENYVVQVVDNNTTDPALWRPLEDLCARLGPRFSFVHLESWPGFKAGALNEAMRRVPDPIQPEVMGIVDADYRVSPDWLGKTAGYFDDPGVAFVQTSQHYRDWQDSGFMRGLFYSFRYFFDITMPARAHRNAIIFCGTMGLVRRSALVEIGGWSEDCITEDAEASLRLLGRGYRGVYSSAAYGEGLMPLSFDGLKKQRFRWCLGGIQILRQHRRELMPWSRSRELQLTFAQRLHYLLGSLQWFAELLTALFTVLLMATAVATALHHRLPLRQLSGAVLAVPLAFAVVGVLRAPWAMRRACGASYRDAFAALRVWFALSWVVALASIRGLMQRRAEFLRTPKAKEGETGLWVAIRSARTESAAAVAAVVSAIAMVAMSPSFATVVLGLMLLFEAFLYGSGPWASMAAEGIPMTPSRLAFKRSPQNTGDRPLLRRGVLVPAGAVAAIVGVAVVAMAIGSPSSGPPFNRGPADLPQLGRVISGPSTVTPPPVPRTSPSVTPGGSPSTTASPGATPSTSATASPSARASSSPSSTAKASASPRSTPSPTPAPSASSSPTP